MPGSQDHTRRALLLGAAASGLVAGTALVPVPARAAEPPALPAAGSPFTTESLVGLARALAASDYRPPATDDLPAALKALTREQYEAIRPAPGSTIWERDDLGFTLEPLHRGSIFSGAVALFLVEDGLVRPLPYEAARFAPEGFALPPLPPEFGYSGFRLRARFDGSERTDFAIFQGASFFQLLARGQGFGIKARSLTLHPADARGEEFPLFRALFVERPKPGEPLRVHALVESESAVAALSMRLIPGAQASLCEVEATLFARRDLDHVGIGGMQASTLFGPIDRRAVDDVRQAAYTAEGLALRTGTGEALWRPLHNPDTLQISAFLDQGPKGFGLMHRTRAFADFEDDRHHWERRPSLWLEPTGDWGEGAVALIEIPSDSVFNENVLAYWRPKAVVKAGTETRFAYRQSWCWQMPEPAPLARVMQSRGGRGVSGTRRLFLVDFQGEGLFAEGGLAIAVSASPGAITRQELFAHADRRTMRALIELDPGSERACELRLVLRRGETVVTETWLYRWTP